MGITKCTIPPEGWRCTRVAGHEGPCAAVPDLQIREQIAITDFIACDETIGRRAMSAWRRWFCDFLCHQTGHLLWRIHGSQRDNPEGSLPLAVTICRRCGLGGYVKGDYWRGVTH